MEQQNKSSNTTLIVIIILAVIVVGLLILGLGGCGVYYWLKNKTPSPTPISTTASVATPTTKSSPTATATIGADPQTQVLNYMKCTLGTIPGASVDYEYAKNYVSAELKEKLDESGFVPLSYCIQDGPSEVSISSEDIDGMESTVVVSANYGGDEGNMWEFLLIYGSSGWIIKEIKCLDTGQVTK